MAITISTTPLATTILSCYFTINITNLNPTHSMYDFYVIMYVSNISILCEVGTTYCIISFKLINTPSNHKVLILF